MSSNNPFEDFSDATLTAALKEACADLVGYFDHNTKVTEQLLKFYDVVGIFANGYITTSRKRLRKGIKETEELRKTKEATITEMQEKLKNNQGQLSDAEIIKLVNERRALIFSLMGMGYSKKWRSRNGISFNRC